MVIGTLFRLPFQWQDLWVDSTKLHLNLRIEFLFCDFGQFMKGILPSTKKRRAYYPAHFKLKFFFRECTNIQKHVHLFGQIS